MPLCTTLDKLLNWYYISINSVTFSLFPWKFVSTTLFTYWIVQVKTILWCYFDFCSTVLNFTCDSPILDIFIISDRYEWLQYRHPANSELFSGYIHYVNEMICKTVHKQWRDTMFLKKSIHFKLPILPYFTVFGSARLGLYNIWHNGQFSAYNITYAML